MNAIIGARHRNRPLILLFVAALTGALGIAIVGEKTIYIYHSHFKSFGGKSQMYDITLILHNLNRWIVLILGVIVVALGIYGWASKRDWSDTDDRLGKYYTIFLDIQLVLGLLLYFIFSPITTSAFRNFGEAMGNSEVRFYLVEHFLIMVIAVILAHIGRLRVNKAETSASKYKNAAIFYGISLLLILMAIPWGRL